LNRSGRHDFIPILKAELEETQIAEDTVKDRLFKFSCAGAN